MSGSPGGALAVAAAVRAGTRGARAVVGDALGRIAAGDGAIRAFLSIRGDAARAEADALDARIAGGGEGGPLAGVPVAVKDNIAALGGPTTCGSRILEGFVSLYDATAVARLRAAGGIVVGKTNLDEFGMGSSTENSAYFPTRNPWDPARVPGGSSGGSAAAVAAGMVPVALGSDTGGSVRQPASFCGVYGLKPTYGRVSRFGLVAYASSLDQIGVFARDLDDLRAVVRAIAGPDPRDATSRAPDAGPEAPGAGRLRVGFAEALLERPGVAPEVARRARDVAAAFAAGGARVLPVSLPDPDEGIAAYYLLATAEASSNLARYDGVRYGVRVPAESLAAMYAATRGAGFGAEVKRRILLGTYALSAGYYEAFYGRAERARGRLRRRIAALFEDVDVVLLPTSPTTAFRLGERTADPLSMYLADVFTVAANLAGIPALNVPAGLDAEGLPIGMQLLAPAWGEERLFAAAALLAPGWPCRVAPGGGGPA